MDGAFVRGDFCCASVGVGGNGERGGGNSGDSEIAAGCSDPDGVVDRGVIHVDCDMDCAVEGVGDLVSRVTERLLRKGFVRENNVLLVRSAPFDPSLATEPSRDRAFLSSRSPTFSARPSSNV